MVQEVKADSQVDGLQKEGKTQDVHSKDHVHISVDVKINKMDNIPIELKDAIIAVVSALVGWFTRWLQAKKATDIGNEVINDIALEKKNREKKS